MSVLYEVYVCKYRDEVVYIGHGRVGRSRHCVSGVSHVYELNKLHFSDEKEFVSVEIRCYYNSKSEAIEREKSLILSHRPRFNTQYLDTVSQRSAAKVVKFRVDMLKSTPDAFFWMSSADGIAYKEILEEFTSFHLYDEYMSDGFKLKCRSIYYKHGFNKLGNLQRRAYNENSTHWRDVFKTNLLKFTKLTHVE